MAGNLRAGAPCQRNFDRLKPTFGRCNIERNQQHKLTMVIRLGRDVRFGNAAKIDPEIAPALPEPFHGISGEMDEILAVTKRVSKVEIVFATVDGPRNAEAPQE